MDEYHEPPVDLNVENAEYIKPPVEADPVADAEYSRPPVAAPIGQQRKRKSSKSVSRRRARRTAAERKDDGFTIDANDLKCGRMIGKGVCVCCSNASSFYHFRPSGFHGAVYKGRWRGVPVAIKASLHADQNESLLAECQLMKTIQPHLNVVTFYGVVTLADGPALVTEFCSGGSLDAALYGDSPLQWTPQQLLLVAHGVSLGVQHLHSQDMVHRDLAARNVLLSGHERVPKVADFGMTRETTDDDTQYNVTRATVGPIRYMAPESLSKVSAARQATTNRLTHSLSKNQKQYSFASDVWSFGVVLFELFEQSPPWKNESTINVAHLVLR